MTKRIGLIGVLFSLTSLAPLPRASAVIPRFISDEELAAYPAIVVGKWEKTELRSHDRYREDEDGSKVITKVEAYTTLNVVRVITGDVGPGLHKVMVGGSIDWWTDGNGVSSHRGGGDMTGDISDVTQANVWFLKKERSWDAKDTTEYLAIGNYREIQPLILEEYFAVLGTSKAEVEVPKLLESDKPEVVRRALRYACGGQWPWPNNTDSDKQYLNPEKRGKILTSAADAVARVIDREEPGDLRALAISVYAELMGTQCVEYVRGLLADDDPDVRAVAASVLMRNKDEQSIDAIAKAVDGVTDAWKSCKIVESILGWRDVRLVPAAISFLENDGAATKAREALLFMTGHFFPFDVKASMEAWEKAMNVGDARKRQALLELLIPYNPIPLSAATEGDSP